jgi:hypothetical protein
MPSRPPRPTAPPQLQSAPAGLRAFVEDLLTLDLEEPWAQPTWVKEAGTCAVWRPPGAYPLVMGDPDVEGNVLVEAELVDSGAGAWLTLFGDPSGLRAKYLTHYVIHGRKALKTQNPPDLRALVAPEVLDLEEWDSLSPEGQANEDPKRIIKLDESAARGRLATGASLFLAP